MRYALSLCLVIIGCGAEAPTGATSSAITGGTPESGHPSAMRIKLGTATLFSLANCTATLVDERAVLTAAHCVMDASSVPHPPEDMVVVLDDTTVIPVTQIIPHPSYSGGAGAFTSDVAVVGLSLAAPLGITPTPLATTPPQDGEPVTLVGFGCDDWVAKTGAGTKRKTSTTINNVWSDTIDFVGPANLCNGDSGGPVYATRGSVEYHIGVHSGGGLDYGVSMRTDFFASWIQQAITQLPPVDTQPPQVSIDDPADGATIDPDHDILVTATDDGGIQQVDLYLDGSFLSRVEQAPYLFAFQTLPPGPHNLRAEAVDRVGRTSSVDIDVTVTGTVQPPTPNNQPPTVSITAPTSGTSSATADVDITIEANDDRGIARIDIKVDGTLYQSISSPGVVKVAELSNGNHTISATAVDTDGAQASDQITIVVDVLASTGCSVGGAPSVGCVLLLVALWRRRRQQRPNA